MERLFEVERDLREYSPGTLAFLGDCVFELLVRERLVLRGNRPVGELNREKIQMVCCKTQAKAFKMLEPCLTEREADIYKSGRNSHVSVPKNATPADYHNATGLEALFGYLYLKGDIERIRELYEKIDFSEIFSKG